MRILLTGATGYIGSEVARQALEQGHEVVGLARSPAARERLIQAGVTPFDGDLHSHERLTDVAAHADGVIHLGLDYGAGTFEQIMSADRATIRALATGLSGTDKGLVTTSGTGVAAPAEDGGITDETAPLWDNPVLRLRADVEVDALSLARTGVRISAIRLPPFVYGRGGSSFVPALLKAALEHGFSPYVEAGTALTSAVDVDEAAKLYLLALNKAPAGSAFNATTEIDIPLRVLAETIGTVTGVPARSLPRAEVEALLGPFVTTFLAVSSRPASARARQQLGWQPQPVRTLLNDIADGSYRELISRLTHEITVERGGLSRGTV